VGRTSISTGLLRARCGPRNTVSPLTLLLAFAGLIVGCNQDSNGILLTWTPPDVYEDGSTLSPGELTEYRVYVDRRLMATVSADQTEYHLALPSGEYDVTVSAVVGDEESRLSEPRHLTIP
jgi:hypothetical protein